MPTLTCGFWNCSLIKILWLNRWVDKTNVPCSPLNRGMKLGTFSFFSFFHVFSSSCSQVDLGSLSRDLNINWSRTSYARKRSSNICKRERMEFLSILGTVIFFNWWNSYKLPSSLFNIKRIILKSQAEALTNTNAQSVTDDVQAASEQSCPIPFVLL